MSQIQSLIYGLDWWQFYDACEALIRISSAPEQLAARIESLFGSEGLPYRMTAAGIEWRLSEPAHTATTEASRILVQSPALQDAVGALEGTARILSGKLTRTFGDIIHTLSKTLGVHSSLSKAMSNVYGYRGAEQAVAHGATASLSDRILEANLVLHWCAAAIVYLERKAEVLGEARS